MIEFINLFMVPMISLGIQLRRENYTEGISLRALVWYSVYVVTETIIMHMIMYLLIKTIGVGAENNSVVYMGVVLIVAILAPYLYELIKKYFDVKCSIERK